MNYNYMQHETTAETQCRLKEARHKRIYTVGCHLIKFKTRQHNGQSAGSQDSDYLCWGWGWDGSERDFWRAYNLISCSEGCSLKFSSGKTHWAIHLRWVNFFVRLHIQIKRNNQAKKLLKWFWCAANPENHLNTSQGNYHCQRDNESIIYVYIN